MPRLRSLCVSVVVLPLLAWLAAQVFIASQPLPQHALRGRTVVVTGASQGIGRALALHLVNDLGAEVLIVSRRLQALVDVVAQVRPDAVGSLHVMAADLSLGHDVAEEVMQRANQLWPHVGVHMVVLNHIIGFVGEWSGANGLGETGAFDASQLERMFAVNALSYMHLATAALPSLRHTQGRLVFVSSGCARMGLPLTAPYAATKGAVHRFAEVLRLEQLQQRSGVSVSTVLLGLITTENAKRNLANAKETAPGASVTNLPGDPPLAAATVIARAGWKGVRESTFPFVQLRIASLLYEVVPHIMDHVFVSAVYGPSHLLSMFQ